jgi:hypothetical protein
VLALVLAVAGCGGRSSPQASGSTSAAPSAPQFTATLNAPTHTPKANASWRWSVKVRDPQGKPLATKVDVEFLFGGQVVGRDSPPTRRFVGSFSDTLQWPAASVGQPLTFRLVVTTAKGTMNLDYPVRVQP